MVVLEREDGKRCGGGGRTRTREDEVLWCVGGRKEVTAESEEGWLVGARGADSGRKGACVLLFALSREERGRSGVEVWD